MLFLHMKSGCWRILKSVLYTDRMENMITSEDDIERFRHKHESNAEWRLRRRNLLAHRETFAHNLNRLLCLANCFINVECYGCRYPNQVMIQFNRLSAPLTDVLQHHRNSLRGQTNIKFVKDTT